MVRAFRSAFAAALISISVAASAQVPLHELSLYLAQNGVVDGDSAHVMLLPYAVGSGIVNPQWSPTGRHIVAQQITVPTGSQISRELAQPGSVVSPEQSPKVIVFQVQTRKTIILPTGNNFVPDSISWFHGTDVLLGVTNSVFDETTGPGRLIQPVSLFWMNVNTGQFRHIPIANASSVRASASPTESKMLVSSFGVDLNDRRWILLDASGRTVGQGTLKRQESLIWTRDGRIMMARPNPDEPRTRQLLILDPRTNELSPFENQPDTRPTTQPTNSLFAQNVELTTPLRSGKLKIKSWVLSILGEDQSENRALIAADAETASVNPDASAVMYQKDGVLQVREIVKIPKDLFIKMNDEVTKREIMNRAKQVGTCLVIFAADHDDIFPGSDSNWLTLVQPYAKSYDIFSGFNYTFKGGNARDIDNPATTELGYIDGPGGRAVVMADTSVRWIPNK